MDTNLTYGLISAATPLPPSLPLAPTKRLIKPCCWLSAAEPLEFLLNDQQVSPLDTLNQRIINM